MKKIWMILLALLLMGHASAEETAGWPAKLFPEVPPLPDTAAVTELWADSAVVRLESGADDRFDAYSETLLESGFDLFADTGIASIFSKGDIDIVLMRDPEEPYIRILNEPDCGWGTDEYLPPLFGRVVSAEETANGTRVVVRGAAPDRVLQYFDDLIAAGWQKEDLFTSGDGTSYGVFAKKNRRITADYYALGFDFSVLMEKIDN